MLWPVEFGGFERHRPETQQIRHRVSVGVLAEKSQLKRWLSWEIVADAAVRLYQDRQRRTA